MKGIKPNTQDFKNQTDTFAMLKSRIIEQYGNQSRFAKDMEMSPGTLSRKLNGKSIFGADEIIKMKELLRIEDKDATRYFFPKFN